MKNRAIDHFTQELYKYREYEVRKIYAIFREMTPDYFQNLIEEILEEDDEEHSIQRQFVYYITLFRKDPYIIKLIKESKIPVNIIESLILSAHSRDIIEDKPEEEHLDKMLSLFDQSIHLELLTKSENISRDTLLSVYIITRLDNKHLDIYFHDPQRIHDTLRKLDSLPEKVINSLFIHNTNIYGYIALFLKYDSIDVPQIRKVIDEFNIDEFNLVKKMILDIQQNFDIDEELNLPLSQRDLRRFAIIINSVKDCNDPFSIIHSIRDEGLIIEEEKSLIMEIMQNPLFSDVLKKYSTFDPSKELDTIPSVFF